MSTLLALLTFVLVPRQLPDPSFKYDFEKGVYRAANPLDNLVLMTVYCGEEFEEVRVHLAPRSAENVVIKFPGKSGKRTIPFNDTCLMSRWEVVR